jgi:hypothetical protein
VQRSNCCYVYTLLITFVCAVKVFIWLLLVILIPAFETQELELCTSASLKSPEIYPLKPLQCPIK